MHNAFTSQVDLLSLNESDNVKPPPPRTYEAAAPRSSTPSRVAFVELRGFMATPPRRPYASGIGLNNPPDIPHSYPARGDETRQAHTDFNRLHIRTYLKHGCRAGNWAQLGVNCNTGALHFGVNQYSNLCVGGPGGGEKDAVEAASEGTKTHRGRVRQRLRLAIMLEGKEEGVNAKSVREPEDGGSEEEVKEVEMEEGRVIDGRWANAIGGTQTKEPRNFVVRALPTDVTYVPAVSQRDKLEEGGREGGGEGGERREEGKCYEWGGIVLRGEQIYYESGDVMRVEIL
ncbi:hypothetical protein K474DRAFT_1752164 [Panus rudis PR-1116 ss-1]|nr:hypothetical protein K474DRAFT_1752164 [Panus rudis PR-1116 ss-1]